MNRKKLIFETLCIIVGTFIMSIAINGLFIPHRILSGGVTGIAVFLHLLLDYDISLVIVLLNIPLFILGYFFINRTFVTLSFIGMVCLSVFLTLTKDIVISTNEILSTILLGGVINGLGIGLIFRFNGSTGGSDIIGKIINKFFSFSLSTVGFAINTVIIGISATFFGMDLAIYTLATMFISSQVIRFVVEGLNYKRTVFIISNQHHEISKSIIKDLHRGVTVIEGMGAYSKKQRKLLYCVIGTRQVSKLKSLVKSIDPKAFVTIAVTSQVIGNGKGFLNLEDDE